MKVFEGCAILVIIGCAIAGTVLGAELYGSHGILAAAGGAVLGGVAGLFVGLNAVCLIEVVAVVIWQVIFGHRRHPAQKEDDNDEF
jgi:hypothetical protein